MIYFKYSNLYIEPMLYSSYIS